MYYFSIDFEFDPEKSSQNLQKHGISFEEARALWTVPGVQKEIEYSIEKRWIRICLWKEKFYTCVFTLREERVRMISVRRSRKSEEKIYQQEMQNEKEDKKNKNDYR